MQIRTAKPEEAQIILDFVTELAFYEKCPEEAVATLEDILKTFFNENPQVFCNFVEVENQIVGFVVWFLNYSTWTGTHGIYVEDLFVLPEHRENGYGKALLSYLANVCVTRGYEQAVSDARALARGREVVLVSHQLPIWIARMAFEGRRFAHDPRKRQCSLASLTSLTFTGDQLSAIVYTEPSVDLVEKASKIAGA